ncbi:MAG: glycerol-3-phosphate 1-O-acyltransferase PlsY [Clostridia bacterium]|nr:glycerol-3-phosphate 1-O-acyltransferase PlsY [Clostridia bacterium]
MAYVLLALCAVIGYLLGSLSASVIISKLFFRGDVRSQGSGNAGATNMARVYGLKGGLIVLLFDFLKEVISMALGLYIGSLIITMSSSTAYDGFDIYCMVAAGGGCLLGHAFPLYFGFKGGKGISVGAALALMIDWRILLIILAVFIIVFILSKIVSVSSISAAAAFVVCSLVFYFVGFITLPEMLLGTIGPVIVIWLHRQNIVRIIKGEEKKFTYKKGKEEKKHR